MAARENSIQAPRKTIFLRYLYSEMFMKKYLLIPGILIINLNLYAGDFSYLIEKLCNDMNKTQETILQENIGAYIDGYNEFGQLWIRSNDWDLLTLGFSWGFIGSVCWREVYTGLYDNDTWNQIIDAITAVFGEPETKFEFYICWKEQNDRLILLARDENTYNILLQRVQKK